MISLNFFWNKNRNRYKNNSSIILKKLSKGGEVIATVIRAPQLILFNQLSPLKEKCCRVFGGFFDYRAIAAPTRNLDAERHREGYIYLAVELVLEKKFFFLTEKKRKGSF